MTILVTLASATDSITFYPDPGEGQYVYNNKTLDAWYSLPRVESKSSKRANAHGSYGLGRIFTGSALPIINGQFFGDTVPDALAARNRLAALFNDGESITMSVADNLGTTTRTVWLLDFDAPFHYDFTHFDLDIALEAPDPRRYGTTVSDSEGMPAPGSGLVWPLGSSSSGLYFDWGSNGILGQVEFMNAGTATTHPRISVGGSGSFAAGFRITEVETGREITYTHPTNSGDTIVFDSRTQRATLAAGDITGRLSSRRWFSVPRGATRRYQINPLGGVTGSPLITISAAPAYL